MVAMFEAQALFGSPSRPGGTVPGPAGTWIALTASVKLSVVVDLSDPEQQTILDTSAQELTGDWSGYRLRSYKTNVKGPTGAAPTQLLGETIHKDARRPEGLVTVSAKVPYHLNLVIFPDRLRRGSYVRYDWKDGSGESRGYRIDHASPEGRRDDPS